MTLNSPRFKACFNPFLEEDPEFDLPSEEALDFHRSMSEYLPTPLLSLPGLADELGVGQILVKDESHRFGLKAFKILGASYAMYRLVRKLWEEEGDFDLAAFHRGELPGRLDSLTFAAASDGNHGRAVAWMARRLRKKAVIFVPEGTVEARVSAIRAEGAEVVFHGRTYDDAVRSAAEEAGKRSWTVVSNTAYEGNTEVPGWMVDGYGTLFEEAEEQIREQVLSEPDIVFVQAGVGGLAAAAIRNSYAEEEGPRIVCVEPVEADGLLESASTEDGRIAPSKGCHDSIMAGLNCATPSLTAWPVVKAGADYFLAVDDVFAEEAMGRFYFPSTGDPRIVAGESGAAGLAGLFALCRKPELEEDRNGLELDEDSTILAVNTEGDTDPESFRRRIDKGS